MPFKLLLFFTTIFLFKTLSINAQELPGLELTVYSAQEYAPLENAEDLTEGFEDWDFEIFQILLEEPIIVAPLNQSFNVLDLWSDGEVELMSELGEYWNYLSFLPFYAEFLNPANYGSSDVGSIHYKFDQGVSYIEFRNVGSYYELDLGIPVNSRFNIIVEIEHSNGTVRYRYGPAIISEELETSFTQFPVPCGLVYFDWSNDNDIFFLGLVHGDVSNPDIVVFYDEPEDYEELLSYFITEYPGNGMVYEISFNIVSSVNDPVPMELTLYPNPASVNLQIQSTELEAINQASVRIMDITGRTVYVGHYQPNMTIDVSSLPAGLYVLQLDSNGKTFSQKWVKE